MNILQKKYNIDHVVLNRLETHRNDTTATCGGDRTLLLALQIYSTSTSSNDDTGERWGRDVEMIPPPHTHILYNQQYFSISSYKIRTSSPDYVHNNSSGFFRDLRFK